MLNVVTLYHLLKNYCCIVASGFGDPHVTTLDGLTYTFNGLGEFVLMRVPDQSIEIQARTGRAVFGETGDLTNATIYTGFAFKTNTGWFQVNFHICTHPCLTSS